jgi:RNA recognition motif-containing protein
MNIYVGNLPSDITGSDLREAFESFGEVETAEVVTHHQSDESRGCGFVDMPSGDEAASAIVGLHGTNLRGQAITATGLRPRDPISGACPTRCHCWRCGENASPRVGSIHQERGRR